MALELFINLMEESSQLPFNIFAMCMKHLPFHFYQFSQHVQG